MEHGQGVRRAAIVLAYVCALSLTFLAGRQLESQTVPFTHAEVENVAAHCQDGEFVGTCTWCSQCKSFEFLNGGCSGFRDSFCSFCESVPHCVRENIECTDRFNSKCNLCECEDPIKKWSDVEINFFEDEQMEVPEGSTIEAVTHACYFGEQCAACSVCPDGQWEVSPCNQFEDTQCAPCTQCGQDEYVKEVCSYQSNTVCAACNHCSKGSTTTNLCSSPFNKIDNHYLVQGADAVCEECSECAPYQWVSAICEEFSDTQCTECASCQEMEYITTECKQGEALDYGRDTACADCTPLESGYFEFEACLKDGLTDTIYRPCTNCKTGEYEETECSPSDDPREVGEDTECPQCEAVAGCPEAHVVCRTFGDSVCSNCAQDEQWFQQTCCEEGYIGDVCEFKRSEYACGTQTYRERSAFRGGFFDDSNGVEGEDFTAFVSWCKNLCIDFSDCTAFEVQGLGWGDAVEQDSICALKNAATVLEPSSAGLTCYSKLSMVDETTLDQQVADLMDQAEVEQ